MQILWSERAKKDLLQILDYLIEEWSSEAAANFYLQTEKICKHIGKHPQMFPSVSKKKKNLRYVSVTKHNRMYYLVNKNTITIVTIFDNRQDPGKLKL